MPKVEKVSLALTPRQAQALRDAVDEGSFATVSEAARNAVSEWADRRTERQRAAVAQLRALWQAGLASGFSEHRRTAEEIKSAGRKRLAELKQRGE